MKKLMLAATAACTMMITGCVTDDDSCGDKKYSVYNGVIYTTSGCIKPGEWTCQYTAARRYAVEHKVPFIFFWGNNGCGICESAERSIAQADFVAWQKKYGAVMAFTVNNAVGGNEAVMMKNALGSVPNYPGVGFYWPKNGVDTKAYDAKIYGHMTGSDIAKKAMEIFK